MVTDAPTLARYGLFVRHRVFGMRLPVQSTDTIEVFDGLTIVGSFTGETLMRVVVDMLAHLSVLKAIETDTQTAQALERLEIYRAQLLTKPPHPIPAERRAALREARKRKR